MGYALYFSPQQVRLRCRHRGRPRGMQYHESATFELEQGVGSFCVNWRVGGSHGLAAMAPFIHDDSL
jgi:hypothetical protein